MFAPSSGPAVRYRERMTLASHCGRETRELRRDDPLRACEGCGGLFVLSATGIAPLAVPFGVRARARWIAPTGLTYRSPASPASVEITIERFWAARFAAFGLSCLLVGIGLVCFGGLIAGTALGLLPAHVTMSPLVGAGLGLAMIALGAALLYAAMAELINRTRLTIGHTGIVRRDLPLPWRSLRTFALGPRTARSVVTRRSGKPQSLVGDWGPDTHKVQLVPPGGDDGMLFELMNEDASVMLAAAITRALEATAPEE